MNAHRHAVATLCGLLGLSACSSKSDRTPARDAGCGLLSSSPGCDEDACQESACLPDAAGIPDEGGSLAFACDGSSPGAYGACGPGVGGAGLFLGTWTLAGTEQYVCAAQTSDVIPESATMTFRPGPGATDAGEIDLLFDGGLGCALTMSVTGGVATLTSAPQTCGAAGKPIDRVFTTVEVRPAAELPGLLQLEETFSDASGCAYLLQGDLLP